MGWKNTNQWNESSPFFATINHLSEQPNHERTAKPQFGQKTPPFKDWVDRLWACADEAGDEGLLVLESDLLDLRDEIRKFV